MAGNRSRTLGGNPSMRSTQLTHQIATLWVTDGVKSGHVPTDSSRIAENRFVVGLHGTEAPPR